MNPLDNIIWHALTTRQAKFAQASGEARRFVAAVGPLAGFPEPSDKNYADLAKLAKKNVVGLFLKSPYQPHPGWRVLKGAPLVQMIWHKSPLPPMLSVPLIQPLGAKDNADMITLAALTEPGPFGKRTRQLGDFFGIRREGQLAAMAGERMKIPGHTEISAVCTHPDHTSKGYAAKLIVRVMQGILERNETPFLHVREDNERAIELYTRLGFRERWSGHYVVLGRE